MKKLLLGSLVGAAMGATGFASSAMAEFGALAFIQDTGAYGWSSGYTTREGAEERAISECGNRRKCKVAIWYEDQCGAIAMGSTGGAGWAPGRDKGTAEDNALDQCDGVDKRCDVLISACSWD
jgi:serine/threonine-protein kinase